MGQDPDGLWQKLRGFGRRVLDLVAGLFTLLGCLSPFIQPKNHLPYPSERIRFFIIVIIGLCSALAYGTLWSIAERLAGWHYGSGGEGKLPSGFSAIVQSLTLTFPLSVVPLFYQIIFHERIIFMPGHLLGSILMMLGGIIGFILMYGVPSVGFSGFRSHLMPPVGNVGILRAITTETVYAIVYFSLIVVPYNIGLNLISQSNNNPYIVKTFISALVFVFVMALFIILKYPESLSHSSWVGIRGFFSGALLPVCLCTALYF